MPLADRATVVPVTDHPAGWADPGGDRVARGHHRQKMAEQALAQEAAHDPLTGLANRNLFIDRLITALSPPAARLARADVGIVFLSLDGFRRINETYGHRSGDAVLLMAAHRLRGALRPQDTAARLGGDDFAVLTPRLSAPSVTGLATRIDAAMGAPHLLCGHQLAVPASLGTHLATPGDSVTDVFQRTYRALNTAKRDCHHKPVLGVRPHPIRRDSRRAAR